MKTKNCISCKNCQSRIISVFKDLNAEELKTLDNIKTTEFYKKGDVLFSEGNHPRGLYCVKSGKIKVSQLGADGKEQIVHLIHDGNVLGHRALLGKDTYSGTALVLEDSQICFIPKTEFYEMMENNGKLTLEIANLLANELKEAERKITTTAQHTVKERIAQSILFTKDHYGLEADQKTINISLKREEMANLAGTTRETATRILYELQTDDIIELNGKRITIVNEAKLIALAQIV